MCSGFTKRGSQSYEYSIDITDQARTDAAAEEPARRQDFYPVPLCWWRSRCECGRRGSGRGGLGKRQGQRDSVAYGSDNPVSQRHFPLVGGFLPVQYLPVRQLQRGDAGQSERGSTGNVVVRRCNWRLVTLQMLRADERELTWPIT